MNSPASLIIRWMPHIAALLVIGLCLWLADWQFDRADEKHRLLQAWEDAAPASLGQPAGELTAHQSIETFGRFDSERHILLDNQIRGGQAGVHVFTPFKPVGIDQLWLINRGWHALPSRQAAVPPIETDAEPQAISGRIADPPRVGVQLGEAGPLNPELWPNLVTYLELEQVETALGSKLSEHIILLDPQHPQHLTGDAWQPVVFGPDRHRAYAWQWLTMALAVFLIWITLSWRSRRK